MAIGGFMPFSPGTVWLTDITEFQLPAGKVYLSPMIDCFDGMAVSWSIGTSPDAELEAAKLTRSMSKKGCTPDNAACEGFFGRLKNEMFYGRSWAGISIEEFIDKLNRYLHWYNEKRIKMSLGSRSPMEYRRSLGYA